MARKKKETKMISRTLRLRESLWTDVQHKSKGLISLSALMSRLLELWVSGEIELLPGDPTEEEGKEED